MIALSHLPTVLGVEQKYSYGGLVEHRIVISEFMDVVVTTSNEKKAPPSVDFKRGTVSTGYRTIQ